MNEKTVFVDEPLGKNLNKRRKGISTASAEEKRASGAKGDRFGMDMLSHQFCAEGSFASKRLVQKTWRRNEPAQRTCS
jgi:hypothetical protein